MNTTTVRVRSAWRVRGSREMVAPDEEPRESRRGRGGRRAARDARDVNAAAARGREAHPRRTP